MIECFNRTKNSERFHTSNASEKFAIFDWKCVRCNPLLSLSLCHKIVAKSRNGEEETVGHSYTFLTHRRVAVPVCMKLKHFQLLPVDSLKKFYRNAKLRPDTVVLASVEQRDQNTVSYDGCGLG